MRVSSAEGRHASLRGRTSLVTGASSGIGRSVATALAGVGGRVCLVGRRPEPLNQLAEQMTESGAECLVCPSDVRDPASVAKAFDACLDAWGTLEIAVLSAGVGYAGAFRSQEPAEWDDMLRTNVLGVAHCVQAALERFDSQAGGDIVTIGSTAGHRVPPEGGFYSATKFAVRSMTESVRLELARTASPSRIACVSPGRVRTTIFGGPTADEPELDPDRVAEMVLAVLDAPRDMAIGDVVLRAHGTRR